MATRVIYNGVELHNVLTKTWNQEVVYDPSNTDVLFCRYKMSFEGIVHVQFRSTGSDLTSEPAWISLLDGDGDAQATSDLSALVATIKARLSESRKDLRVYFDDVLVVDCLSCESLLPYQNAGSASTTNSNRGDVDNGPKPRTVSITHVGGAKVFRVAFSIDCAMVQTHTGTSLTSLQPSDKQVQWVLSNRWSISETLDENYFTSRTIRGRMRTSSPCYSAFHPYFKCIVVPSLETGFKRDRLVYSVSENQLDVEYEITDKQVFYSAPWPASKMEATYTESTDDGVSCFGEVTVRLEGTPASSVPLLIQRALQVADAKLKFSVKNSTNCYQLSNCSITEYVGEKNAVEVRMRIRHLEELTTLENYTKLFKENFSGDLTLPKVDGQPAEYDQKVSFAPARYGYDPHGDINAGRSAAYLFLIQCYLQTPWGTNAAHAIGTATVNNTPPTYTPGTQDTTVTEVPYGTIPPAGSSNQSAETLDAVYTYVRAESKYITAPCRVQMPIAAEPAETADTCIVFDLGAKQARREIRVDAERVGKPPEIPEPADTFTDGQIKGTLLKYWDRSLPPTLAADKTQKIYRIEAYYLYALNRPPLKTEPTKIGVLQNTKFTQSENALTRSPNVYTDRMKVGD
ncbi:hypothetical protein [Trichococcus shcherbakoviae]|uniref:hypothetical protein n=1 Tax=Trichococcus shcherbakoviae TaxID=2094020 RepID=UPI002AA69A5D|nr:hypothetical protein [Trichococcus shcherbakoviae]